MFLCTCRMQLWQPCQNFLVKTLKTFCSNSGNAEKNKNFPKNLFLLKMFVWTCTKKFWQDWRNFVSKNTKEFPIVQIRWSYIFLSEVVFIKNDSLATEIAILTTLPKIFLQKTTDLSLRFQKEEKNYEFLEGNLFFVKLCFCTCRIHLWPPREKFVLKTLKTFRSNSGKDEKLVRFPNKLISPKNVRLNMHNEILASLS